MKKETKHYLLRAVGMTLFCWFLSLFFVPGVYPPRHTIMSEYVFVVIVGLSSALLAYSNIPWRYSLYYAFLAGLPEVSAVIWTYGKNYSLQYMIGHDPSPTVVLFPVGRILLLLGGTATVATLAAAYMKSKHADKTPAEQNFKTEPEQDIKS